MLSKIKLHHLFLFLILSLSLWLRTSNLNHLPPALFSDEVDAGYQAYIFNQYHTDYFGNFFPTHFHSFSDWRTPLHIYSIALFQKFTDLETSTRLPSAFFGLISTLIIYLITKSKTTALVFAISPWAIHFGRTGFEVSGMVACILLGILFWQHKKLFLSSFFFILSTYFYSTSKIFIVIIAVLIFTIWYQEIVKIKFKKMFLLMVFSLLVASPMVIDTINQKSGFRFSYISIFSQPHKAEHVDQMRYEDIFTSHQGQIGVAPPPSSFLFHNKYQVVIDKFLSNYISSFSTDFLILKGDSNLRHGSGNFGPIYPADMIFVLIGIFYSFYKKPISKLSLFFFWLLILAPVPFSLTRDSNSPHATRLILMLPSIVYFISIGIKQVIQNKKFLAPVIGIVYLVSFSTFWHHYNLHYPQLSARSWHTGMKEVINLTKNYTNQKIFYSSKYESFLPFFFFYNQYEPKSNVSPAGNLVKFESPSFSGHSLDDRHYFGFISWSQTTSFPANSIVIIPKSELAAVPQNSFTILKEINKKYIEQEEFLILKPNEK